MSVRRASGRDFWDRQHKWILAAWIYGTPGSRRLFLYTVAPRAHNSLYTSILFLTSMKDLALRKTLTSNYGMDRLNIGLELLEFFFQVSLLRVNELKRCVHVEETSSSICLLDQRVALVEEERPERVAALKIVVHHGHEPSLLSDTIE